jgi:hypothetical protein
MQSPITAQRIRLTCQATQIAMHGLCLRFASALNPSPGKSGGHTEAAAKDGWRNGGGQHCARCPLAVGAPEVESPEAASV